MYFCDPNILFLIFFISCIVEIAYIIQAPRIWIPSWMASCLACCSQCAVHTWAIAYTQRMHTTHAHIHIQICDHTIKGINNKKPIMVRNTWNPAEPWTKRECNESRVSLVLLMFLLSKWYNIDSLTFSLIKSTCFISILSSLLRSLVLDESDQVHECFITSISQIKVLSSICWFDLYVDWSVIRFQSCVSSLTMAFTAGKICFNWLLNLPCT